MQSATLLKPESKPLSKDERRELNSLEACVKKHLNGFRDIGFALATINNKELFREDYDTFEEYCLQEWDISRFRAYQYINSYLVYDHLLTMVNKDETKTFHVFPENERQCRALVDFLDNLEQLRMVWRVVVENAESSGERITASFIQRCIETLYKKKVSDTIKKATQRSILEYTLPQPIADSFQGFMLALRESSDAVLEPKGRKHVATMLRQLLETIEK